MNNPNPYAPNSLDGTMVVEERTSVLAIVALVLSLICFIPGFGILGAILGIVALILIGNSGGRLGGRGLAIAALIIGLLVSAIQIAVVVGFTQMTKQFTGMFVGNASTMLQAAEAGDFATARKQLDPSVANSITDDDFKRFVAGYTATLGNYKRAPSGLGDLISAYSKMGPQLQGMNNSQGVFPLPVEFDKGWAIVALQLNQGAGNPNTFAPLNVEILTGNQLSWKLYDPTAAAGATAPTPQGATTPPNAPAPAPAPAPKPTGTP